MTTFKKRLKIEINFLHNERKTKDSHFKSVGNKIRKKEIKILKKEYNQNYQRKNTIKIIKERIQSEFYFGNCETGNIVNIKKSSFMNPTQIIANGKPVKNPKDVFNTFNNYASIGPNTEQSIPKSQRAPVYT